MTEGWHLIHWTYDPNREIGSVPAMERTTVGKWDHNPLSEAADEIERLRVDEDIAVQNVIILGRALDATHAEIERLRVNRCSCEYVPQSTVGSIMQDPDHYVDDDCPIHGNSFTVRLSQSMKRHAHILKRLNTVTCTNG